MSEKKYHGELLPAQESEKTRVDKIHFLIHPAFQMLTNTYANLYVKNKGPEYDEVITRTADSLNATIEHAKTLQPNEMMIAFLFGRPKHIKDQRKLDQFNAYTTKINALRTVLKDRLIVFADGDDKPDTAGLAQEFRHILMHVSKGTTGSIKRKKDMPNKSIVTDNPVYLEHIVQSIRSIAKARGFTIDPQTISDAYGEEMLSCVRDGTVNIHKALGLKPKTTLLPKLTELARDSMSHEAKNYQETIRHYKATPGSQTDARYIRFQEFEGDTNS